MVSDSSSQRAQAGFTLVELSVVLAIIGLLVGGVMGGQYLVRQSALQSVATDLTRYRSAWHSFKSQYDGMAGDITDATSYWGIDTTSGLCPGGSTAPHKETCDGDGNNNVSVAEGFRAWQQLSNAGLVEGTFSGVRGTSSANQAVPGQNVPPGDISNTGYTIFSGGAFSVDANYYNSASPAVLLIYGLRHATAATYNAVLTSREQYGLDLKIDDGLPARGDLRAYKASGTYTPGCTSGDTSAATYSLTTGGVRCSIVYMLEWN